MPHEAIVIPWVCHKCHKAHAANHPCKSSGSARNTEGGEACQDCVIARGKSQGGSKVSVTLYEASSQVIGNGAFGTVYKIKSKIQGRKSEFVALKKPKLDAAGVEQEIKLLQHIKHPNMVSMKFSLLSNNELLLGMELVEDGDLYEFIKKKYNIQDGLGIYTEVFGYQLFRGLAYLEKNSIVHRDIKPENLLVSEVTGEMKLGDFGCATRLHDGAKYSCCIGTKEFRAPELLLHSKKTTCMVDVWSAMVVMTEMAGGKPLFGEGPRTAEEQLLRIALFLGIPHLQNPRIIKDFKRAFFLAYGENERPSIQDYFFLKPVSNLDSFIDMLQNNLVYNPNDRMKAWDICAHDYFTKRLMPGTKLPNGNPLPKLFNFSTSEVASMSPNAQEKLLPRTRI